MNKNIVKINNKGASLLEVMIAMVILTVGFLGVMALAVALTNNNATAGKINTATTIAQAQVSQLNCLGISGVENNSQYFSVPGTYQYTVTPSITNPYVNPQADTRSKVTSCINPIFTYGNPGYPVSIGVTIPYTVKIVLSQNQFAQSLINAQISVIWYDNYCGQNKNNICEPVGEHEIMLYDTVG